MQQPNTLTTWTITPFRVTTKVQLFPIIKTEPTAIPDTYTTEEDDSDLNKIEISPTSTFEIFEEIEVAAAVQKIAEGDTKMSKGWTHYCFTFHAYEFDGESS